MLEKGEEGEDGVKEAVEIAKSIENFRAIRGERNAMREREEKILRSFLFYFFSTKKKKVWHARNFLRLMEHARATNESFLGARNSLRFTVY